MFSLLPFCFVALALGQGPGAPRPAAVRAKPAPGISAPAKPAAVAPIPWSAALLTLADFRGRPAPGTPWASLTSADIKAKVACTNQVFSGSVQATFDPATSWFRDAKSASPALLRHEQLHFDLTEVYARRLRQKLAAFKASANCTRLQPAFDNLTKPVYAEWDREESLYDRETNHGLDAVRQAYWEKKTQLKLEQLKAFAE